MLCLVCSAFFCCGLGLLRGFMCEAAGPMRPECRSVATVSYPLASLSICAAVAMAVLVGGKSMSMGRR